MLWNMTEDDETKLDVFSVAPDGKFSKLDPEARTFLPYADLDALVVNPAMVKPRPGSKAEEAAKAAEEEAKEAAERERLERGEDIIPASAVSPAARRAACLCSAGCHRNDGAPSTRAGGLIGVTWQCSIIGLCESS